MPRFSVEANIPTYVLRDGSQPIGPTVAKLDSELMPAVIYSFSSKRAYDEFSASSPLALTPYPLVKGFLTNRINETAEGLQLLAIDASGPVAPTLHAATMKCVLDALSNQTDHVNAEHLLVFDPEASAYRLTPARIEPTEPETKTE